ncbi:kinase-like domain-containing protein [Rhizoctonia solani]|nr:kinase-like domain-containing protein [Rhizoctonia solani]
MAFLTSPEHNLTERITITQILADTSGSFSNIHKGILAEDSKSGSIWKSLTNWKRTSQCQTQTVAIKAIRGCENLLPVEHCNVLPLLGYMEGVSGTVFPSLVAPWCDLGSLDKYITHHSPRPADRASLMIQIMSAVSYLHSYAITHEDLKPLSDFGLAKIPFNATGSRFSSSHTQDAGTLHYIGPEFFFCRNRSKSPRGQPADVWALAWTFYVSLTGVHPYSEMSGAPIMKMIDCVQRHNVPLEPSDVPSRYSPTEDLLRLWSTVWPIMRRCWEINPIHRPMAEEVEQRLREAILLEHSLYFDGPTSDSEMPDETRPSVIGDEDTSLAPILIIAYQSLAFFLELKAEKLRAISPDKARDRLVAATLGYLCHSFRTDAYTTQIQIGWILIDQHQFLAAQAHFHAARRAVDTNDLIVACKRGLARAALGLGKFDEAIEHYYSALVLCRTGSFVDYEYMIVREAANAVLDHPKTQGSPKEILMSQNSARKLFKEALSFSMDPEHVNLEYQARVRCDLVQLESNAGNEATAQAHALAAFQCALETGRRSVADDVYNYLLETDVLSEAQLNAFRIDLLKLHAETAHVPKRGVDSLGSSWVASIAPSNG